MRPLRAAVHAAARMEAPSSGLRPACTDHSERFSTRRPRSTSREMSHETGASLLYQGHFVTFEWQSMHARRSSAWTAGVTRKWLSKLRSTATGGLRLGRRAQSSVPTITAANARAAFHFVTTQA